MKINKQEFKIPKITLLPFLIVILFVLLPILNNFWIDLSWFKETGYQDVFLKNIYFKVLVGAGLFLFSFLIALITLTKTIKSIPDTYIDDDDVIDISMAVKKPGKSKIFIIAGLFSFIISSLFTGPLWKQILLFINQEPFNYTDPIFNNDVSFYFFTLPLIEMIVSPLMFFSIAIIALNALVYGFYYRKIRKQPEQLFNKFGFFLVIFFLLMVVNYRVESLKLIYSTRGSVYGAGYTDILIGLKFYYLKMAAAFISAIFIYLGLKKQNFKKAMIGPILLIAVTLIGSVAEMGVQNFIVSPNELSKEESYIEQSIKYTQKAYKLDEVERQDFPALWNLSATDIENSVDTIKNIRVNDFRPTQTIYNQLQSIRLYYQFTNISIDRYLLNGEQRQVFLSAREIDHTRLPEQAKNWINQHLKYTHGYGAAVSPVNEITPQGQPKLIVKNIPPETEYEELRIDTPEIYYGNLTKDYIIVNTTEKEFNYPMENQNAETMYSGDGGIKLNLLNRIVFSIDKRTPKILISGAVSSDSKILINRDIQERVAKIAPFLKYESDPYLVINEGKLYWVIDGYTTSNRFPYSQPVYSDNTMYNYIRNSVKVVIDAYHGTTDFYIYDDKDPIIMTYSKAYPSLFKSAEDMPEGIRKHMKYPVELFDIQSNIFSIYHMDNPRTFFNREDAWSIATEKYQQEVTPVRPYYINMALPGNDEVEFVLVQPYTAYQKNNMVSWFAARNDGDNYGKLVVYSFPKQRLIYGPMQIESRIDQDAVISSQLTLWERQGSSVVRGNLMVIPIKDSILYVEPLYLQSDNANALPEVKQIILAYGDDIVMEATLEAGLKRLFNYDSENIIDDEGNEIIYSEDIYELIQQANTLFNRSQESLRQGNWNEYGKDLEELENVLEKLESFS
ncbi:MAG: UPF0182 family protein [Eubacteriales bacterium]|nr:UPF0182 family protein [Eubacteriales bacterium]